VAIIEDASYLLLDFSCQLLSLGEYFQGLGLVPLCHISLEGGLGLMLVFL